MHLTALHHRTHLDREPVFARPRACPEAAPARGLEAFVDGFDRCAPRAVAPQRAAACAPACAPAANGLASLLAQLLSLLGLGSAPRAPAAPDTYARVPEVGGAPSDWARVHGAVADRLSGSEANRAAIHQGGQSPWTADGRVEERAAVWWAMQKNGDVKYDADQKVFYTTRGGQRDQVVASLDDVLGVVRSHGGARPDNGAAFAAVGAFMDERVRASRAT